jgi:hypothetical protein
MYYSVRMAVSEYLYAQDTPESLQAAIAWEPGNADYHALLAEHQESAGLSPEPELLKAAGLSPLTSSFLVRAALRSEVERNFPLAEQQLKQATAVDRKFPAHWALLNFYFRRGSETGVWPPGFWPSVNQALEMSSPEDTDAVFHLAWEQTHDAGAILSHLPAEKPVLDSYLRFLIRTERMDAADPVARRLAKALDATDATDALLLLDYCDRAAAKNSDAAVTIWNLLASRKLITGSTLNPARGTILNNKEFIPVVTPRVFDWQVPPVDGIYVSQAGDGHGISLHFDGNEPDNAVVLTQTMPLIEGKQYRIGFEYSSSGRPFSGLKWEVIAGDRILAASPEMDSAKDGTPGQVAFRAEAPSARLALHYQRPAGSLRAEGTITIRKLTDQISETDVDRK